MKKSTLLTCTVFTVMILGGLACYQLFGNAEGGVPPSFTLPNSDPPPIEITVPEDSRTSIFAVGDNLVHDVIYKQAKERAGGTGYNFDYAYSDVEKLIPTHGITFVNQETPLATALYPPSNYPLFNTPTEVGDKLVDLGFNLINQANNHMFDKWSAGLEATMEYWATKDVTFIGAYPKGEEMAPIILEQGGIKIGLLSITDHTNGIIPGQDSPGYILSSQRDVIEAQIQALNPLCDFIIVSAHWGNENTFTPPEEQQQTAEFLADLGVGLILGHHSHTVQPIEWLEGKDGNQTLVVHSMGNFISAMADWYNMLGGVFQCDLVKDGVTGKVIIENPKMIPIVTHYESRYQNLKVVPLAEYTDEMAKTHGLARSYRNFTPAYLQQTFEEIISSEFR